MEILWLKNYSYSISKIIKVQTNDFIPEIRFEKKQWLEPNLFMLSGDILEQELVFCVKNYWIKTKIGWQMNSVHHPDKTLVIAYYFPETNHVKLYFPDQIENKWYSNCTTQDIFGYHKIDYYGSLNKDLWITKSGKDRLMMDYFIGVPSIALQNEGCYLPDNIFKELEQKFSKIRLLYDNDITGILQAQKLSEKYNIEYKIIDVFSKDPYEMIQEFGVDNTKKLIL